MCSKFAGLLYIEGTLGSSVITRFIQVERISNIDSSLILQISFHPMLQLESSSIKHSSLCTRFRSCSTGAVLHLAVGVTPSPCLLPVFQLHRSSLCLTRDSVPLQFSFRTTSALSMIGVLLLVCVPYSLR